ncbi:hypothetical protein PSI19_21365 [Xenorhabdus khoisanae]|uniref:hypothetical protein n=1 Tax=Xenorhabdus khoisanae TaxID=880157 RepID=UPI0023591225|nr:hypothetical protein [Xenorhabdus khoisanae]MDC9616344.1 hypothetical protein [Xenorhabdus khoisanae]
MMKEYSTLDENRKIKRDPKDLRSSEIGSGDNQSKYQIEKYATDPWNNSGVVNNNNCYSYACNICTDSRSDPGARLYANRTIRTVGTVTELKEGMKYDGLVEIQGGLVKKSDDKAMQLVQGTLEKPAWRVAVFVTKKDNDPFGYHFFREVWSIDDSVYNANSDGTCWAHKFFSDPVTNLTIKESEENRRHAITNPEVEMREWNKRNTTHYELLGYYLVKPDVKIGTY